MIFLIISDIRLSHTYIQCRDKISNTDFISFSRSKKSIFPYVNKITQLLQLLFIRVLFEKSLYSPEIKCNSLPLTKCVLHILWCFSTRIKSKERRKMSPDTVTCIRITITRSRMQDSMNPASFLRNNITMSAHARTITSV